MRLRLIHKVTAATIALSSLLTVSCDNEIEINAPVKDVTVVYGLLNSGETTHKFKINRLVQNTTTAGQTAKDRSAAEYPSLNAWLIEGTYDISTQKFTPSTPDKRAKLVEFEESKKDSGMFYYPSQKLYKVENFNLNPAKNYRLEIIKTETETVSANTSLIENSKESLLKGLNSRVGFRLYNDGEDKETRKFSVKVLPPNGAKSFDVKMKFRYVEEFKGGQKENKYFSVNLGTYTVPVVGTTNRRADEIDVLFGAKTFYQIIANKIPPMSDTILSKNVVRRIPDSLSFEVALADPTLNAYIEVNKPTSSLLEDKPPYTNVNGGIGIFASRGFSVTNIKMSKLSMDELVNGTNYGITGDRGFCFNNQHHTSTDPRNCF